MTAATSASPEGEAPWPEDAVEVGYILDAWGVKGAFKVKPFASDPQALFSSRRWFLKPAEGRGLPGVRAASALPLPHLLKITSVKEHGEFVVVQAQEAPDRTAAEGLRGARVFVSRGSFPTPDPDEYYWVDLIGLAVVNRQGAALGTVAGLLDTGPHSVLRVSAAANAAESEAMPERLIPFVAAYVDEVSLSERRITVDWDLDY